MIAAVVNRSDVEAAVGRIAPYVVRTPLERSRALSTLCGHEVWLKFECFQATGSFKLRGALNALLRLDPRTEVVTASAGNHGLGVARAAQILGMRATVVVPENASSAKVEALRASGAELRLIGQTYDDAELAARRLAQQKSAEFVSAYNDPHVVAGGGTIALEVLEDAPSVETLIVPAGGGGLLSGIAIAAEGRTVVGVQSEASPALHAAFTAGRRVTVQVQESLADGLAGNVEEGSITLALIHEHVNQMVLVSEAQIAGAMRWLLEHEHVLVEGSAAVGVAALLNGYRPGGATSVVLTGRNVSGAVLRQYVLAT
jgi:threonine dehydratase